jgi:hypothetical protein
MTSKIRFDLPRVRNSLVVEVRDEDEQPVIQYLTYNAGSTNDFGAYIVTLPLTLPADSHYTAYLLDTAVSPFSVVGLAHFYWDGTNAFDPAAIATRNVKIEDDYTLAEVLRVHSAALAGTCSQSGSVIRFKSLDGSTDRIIATTTETGNRTAITLDATDV